MHGHTHDGVVIRDGLFGKHADPRYLCVSVEQPHVNYKPLLLDEALNILRRNQE